MCGCAKKTALDGLWGLGFGDWELGKVIHAADATHQRDENLRIGQRPIPLRIFASFAPSRFIFLAIFRGAEKIIHENRWSVVGGSVRRPQQFKPRQHESHEK
jgi:hypothetical protein